MTILTFSPARQNGLRKLHMTAWRFREMSARQTGLARLAGLKSTRYHMKFSQAEEKVNIVT